MLPPAGLRGRYNISHAKNVETLEVDHQLGIELIEKWSEYNALKPNLGKTESLKLTKKQVNYTPSVAGMAIGY